MDDLESKRQNLARRLVEREVYCCVSSLMSDLAQFEKGEYYDEVLDAQVVENVDEALEAYIDNADADELEALIEENGYWDDFIADHLPRIVRHDPEDDDGCEYWTVDGSHLTYEDEDDAKEAAVEMALPQLRLAAYDEAMKLCDDERKELCEALDIDWHEYRAEVYEHWIVTDWLACKLRERSNKVIEIYGLDIWCRCCTGQAICLDNVIQNIAMDLWGNE